MQKQVMTYLGIILTLIALKSMYASWCMKEARVEYFKAAATCYESAKQNPTLVVICPRLDEKDYE